MTTPICDFVRAYANRVPMRLHMPGHKGVSSLGVESLDITEVTGADVLYGASGIILESQENAARLFGAAKTLYSTEGSSLSIRAMLYLACRYAKEQGNRRARIAAGRNAHKTLISAAALLDFELDWLYGESLLCCEITGQTLESYFESCEELPTAVYLTSPDYLGNMLDIASLAEVCHAHGVLLLVDNAHGAYLKFLPKDAHPIALGADASCDSAHKTLPALTGCAYLHLSERAPKLFFEEAESAMSLFASTSPSYLLLQSLDALNLSLSQEYRASLASLCAKIALLRQRLLSQGFELLGNEPTKLTIAPKSYGYTGEELASILRESGIECEFCDRDFLVCMFSAAHSSDDLCRLEDMLASLPRRSPVDETPPAPTKTKRAMSIREAMFSVKEKRPTNECLGCVFASMSVSCPPAIPVAVCGEVIDEQTIQQLNYYGITECEIVK